MVFGFGLVNAKTRADATLSAYVLNSAPGVIWFLRFSFRRNAVSGCLIKLKCGTGMEVTEGEDRRERFRGWEYGFRKEVRYMRRQIN